MFLAENAQTLAQVLLSPQVLLTVIICALAAGGLLWLLLLRQRHKLQAALAEQRTLQEGTLQRLLSAVEHDKKALLADHEAQLRERDQRVESLEREAARLRDRLSSAGLLGLFGGRQREVVAALLLENEQLHELLVHKQDELRTLLAEMNAKLLSRIDEQAQDGARAVRYKQVLLSAFLQREEARQLLDSFLAEARLPAPKSPEGS
jgi:hypothetical protein